MKKLLALVLVLGLASMANAAFVINAPDKVMEGTALVPVSIDMTDGPYSIDILVGAGGLAQDIVIAAGGRDTGLDAINTGMDVPEAGFDFEVMAANGANPPIALVSPFITFNLNTAALVNGDVIIVTVRDYGSYLPNFDPVGAEDARFAINIVPEPMTMSLLALGGLGLLRRRRN